MFTCGLMKDPTPLIDHVYEAYIENLYHYIIPDRFQRDTKAKQMLLDQGKDINSTSLFNTLYTESRVPLYWKPRYNQFVCLNASYKVEIATPSKLYMFVNMREANVPVTKFAEQDEREEAPECVLWILNPDAAAVKNLFSTCCEISKRQPVTHLLIADATCKDLTPAEAPALSRNVKAVFMADCVLPIRFWEKILHQLFNCVNLRSLVFENTNLRQLQKDGNTGLTNRQVEVYLSKNNFSEKFMEKWNGSSSGIICNFQQSESSDDEHGLTSDEINWLIEEQALSGIEINLSRENITADLVNAPEMSKPLQQLILRECSISDGAVFEAILGLPANKFITVLDLGGTKLGHNAMYINCIVAHGNLKQLLLPHCDIPTTALDLILPLLSCCKELTHLNLCGNNLEASGHHIAEFTMALGDKPTLKELNLGHCSITREACVEVLLALGNCKSLTTLNMAANCRQGCLDWFLPHPHEGLHSFGKLFLECTSLNSDDMSHLAKLIEKRKLPMLEELNLASNALHTMEAELENLVGACVTHHTTELKVNICDNDLPYSFEDKCRSLCYVTSIILLFIEHCIDLPWTEDALQSDDEQGDDNKEQNKAFEEDKEEVNDARCFPKLCNLI